MITGRLVIVLNGLYRLVVLQNCVPMRLYTNSSFFINSLYLFTLWWTYRCFRFLICIHHLKLYKNNNNNNNDNRLFKKFKKGFSINTWYITRVMNKTPCFFSPALTVEVGFINFPLLQRNQKWIKNLFLSCCMFW